MEKYFRTEKGELVNAVEHTLEQINKYPNLKIYIGTDSQVFNPKVRYVTAIVYRYNTRGAHYIYYSEIVPKIKDNFLRLYNEGARTLEAASLLTDELPVEIEALEFDYAGVKKTISSPLVSAFKGYRNAVFKGGAMIASKAADHILRKNKVIEE